MKTTTEQDNLFCLDPTEA
jgi:hypothetical protein